MPPPKFSILLPTRNRLELAKSAIETVRRQTYSNWEIIISDNCSQEDVAEFVSSLNEPRIIYSRSNEFIPVTANWNRAINAASGDYVLMLGDDEGLTPNYFEKILSAIGELDHPEFIYHGAYQFTYPGVVEAVPDSKLVDVSLFSVILQNCHKPQMLPLEMAREVGRKSLDLWALYGFNMQHFMFSRSFINRMSIFGEFFQGPFPDFYAANMAMLVADKIGVIAEPLVIIGITPKSYGYFHNNSKEKDGIAFLQGKHGLSDGSPEYVRRALLPGTNMLNSWFITVSQIPEKLPDRKDLAVGIERYRRLQIIHNIQQQALTGASEASLSEFWSALSLREKLFAIYLKLWMLPLPLMSEKRRVKWSWRPRRRYKQFFEPKIALPPAAIGKYNALLDVFADLAKNRDIK